MTNDFTQPLKPWNNRDISKEEKKIAEKIKSLDEKLEARRWQNQANENPFLERNGIKAVKSSTYAFWKVFAVLCFLTLLFFLYLTFYTDKLDGFVSPSFNNQFDNNVNNNYEFNSTTNVENGYEFNPNYTINNYNNIICPNSTG